MEYLKQKAVNLLRRTEVYTKTDMLYLAKGGSFLTLAQISNSLFVFVMAILFARFVDKEIYGTYQFILSLLAIVSAVSLTGLGPALTRAVARGETFSSSKLFWKNLSWNMASSAVALGIALYYFIQGNRELGIALCLVALAAPLLQVFQTYDAVLIGKHLFRSSAQFQVLRGFLSSVCMVAIVLLTDSVIWMLAGYIFAHVLITGFLYLFVHRKYIQSAQTSPEDQVAGTDIILSAGKHFSLINVIGKVSSELDRILLFHFLGPVHVAIYTFALAAPRQIQHINKTLKGLLIPKLSLREPEILKQTLPRKALLMYAYIIPILFVYIPLAPFLYKLFFPAYVTSAVYSQVYSLVLLFAPIIVLQEALVAHQNKRALYILNTAVPITRLTFLIALVPFFGVWGVITATLSSLAVQAVLVTRFFSKL